MKDKLAYLHKLKSEQSKVNWLIYDELKMADYLLPSNLEIGVDLAKFIAKLQTRMVKEVKHNFKNMHQNLICDSCNNGECKQEHLLMCKELMGKNEILTYIPDYKDIWNGDLEEKMSLPN